jgi:SAM-dependent methyltransferase
MSDPPSEIEAIRQRYARRSTLPTDRYSRFSPDVLARVQERQRALVHLLRAHGVRTLSGRDIIEVGCGTGTNLLELIEFGAEPERLVGNDLLPDRLAQARRILPPTVHLQVGDASDMPFAAHSCDIVYQSTVFSSVLDNALQLKLAEAMWRWLRPGGALLWYDFTFDNPANSDVKGVPLTRVRELFPDGSISHRRITLAPPIARRAMAIHPSLYNLLDAIPLLRTHLLCWIRKS